MRNLPLPLLRLTPPPLPVGSGARALGQGGAFIAVADDATAASWNPGALIQLERPELSIVGSYPATQQNFDPGSAPFELGNESVSRGDLNYASVAYPFRILRKNFVAALNYQQVYDFHMNLDYDKTSKLRAGSIDERTVFESNGGVGALTPAISMMGTTYKTQMPETREHFEEDYPMSFGVGLGFRYNDALSFSTDVTWTDWSVFKQRDENGNESRPIGGASMDTRIGDTYAVRSGAEYLIFRRKAIIPVRGGLFYDPRPSLDDPVDVYGFSAGSGITFKRFSIDAAYQFSWAHNVGGEDFGLPGTKFDFNDHLFLTSLIVYF